MPANTVAPERPVTQQPLTTPVSGGELTKVHTPTVITTPEDFRTTRQGWLEQSFHILTPVADFRALPPCFGLMPAQVQINPDPAKGEVYSDPLFCKDGEFALTKQGLSKIAIAAGMSIRTERTDPRTIQNLWEVKATARFIGIDGTPQDLDATEELDLRDGTARSEKVMGRDRKVGALIAARSKGLRNCEARAVNAAIRLFGVKQKYTAAELAKPFVVLRVMFIPDMTDPETRRFITERALQGTTALYANATRAALPEPEHLDTIGAEPSATAPPPASDVLLVSEVASKNGSTDGRPWTLFRVSFSDGRYAGTFDMKLAEKARKAKDGKIPVRQVAIDESGRNPKLTTLVLAGEPEDVALPLDMPDLDKL